MKLAARDDRQLGLEIADPPRQEKTAVLRSFHTRRQPLRVEEALEGERRARAQETVILDWFRLRPGKRVTPSEVQDDLLIFGRDQNGRGYDWPLTSIRARMTTLTKRGLLLHHAKDRRPSPLGGKESTWSLVEPRP